MSPVGTERPLAVLTGATGGIGSAAALELARRGYDLALLAPEADGLAQLAGQAEEAGARVDCFPGDLADLEYAERSIRLLLERRPRIDALINNAAWREIVTMRRISLDSWNRTLAIGLTAPAFLSRWCAAAMEERGAGVIVNISSIQAFQAGGLSPAYIAAKGGLDALTYELAALYSPHGIRVLGLNLGAIDTAMSADYPTNEAADSAAKVANFGRDMIPLRRFGTPQEVARLIAAMLSEDASYISGTNITADGGWAHHHFPHSLKKLQFPAEFE